MKPKSRFLDRPPSGSRGMTLVETLVALSIAVVLMALVFSVFSTATRVMRGQDRRGGKFETLSVLDRIADELSCACVITTSNAPAFSLSQSDETVRKQNQVLEFTALSKSGDGMRWHPVVRKKYSVGNDNVLNCNSKPLRGPGAMATGTVARVLGGIASFKVEVYVEGEWHQSWESQEELPFPKIVRLGISRGGESFSGTNYVQVMIPAGNPVASTIERSSGE